ncbi:MAG: hypothetical protein JM58_05300 [Peptococcaceae bacterium BICA1-8]|nr:MAG: hypothetical protein JM58_05300 [Peptococcaceae bacterium BICA1-8]
MNNKDKVLSMLGLAQKAGKLVSGESAVKAVHKKGQIYLLILADDFGENRKKYWMHIATEDNIPVIVISSKLQLGVAVGLSPRALLGITDKQMAMAIEKNMQ